MDAHPYRSAVTAELRAEMARQRKNKTNLSRKTGIPARSLARRLSGDGPLDVEDLALIAGALGKSPAEFLPTGVATDKAVSA